MQRIYSSYQEWMIFKPGRGTSYAIKSCYWTALTVIIALLLQYNGLFIRVLVDKLNMNDFGKIYFSAQALIEGDEIYGESPATHLPMPGEQNKNFWNLNPPHLLLTAASLALLPAKTALFVWAILNVACLLFSIELIAKEIHGRLKFKSLAVLTLAILMCSATSCVLATGQFSFILLLLFTLAWRNARNNRWIRAGAYMGVLISLKLFFLLFIPYFVLRQRIKSTLIVILTAISIFAVGIAILGPDCYVAWVQVLGKVDWHWASMNGSLLGFLTRVLTQNPYYSAVTGFKHLVYPLWISGFIVAGILSIASASFDNSKHAVDRGFAMLLIAALLMSPLGWLYYLWLIAPPITPLVYHHYRQLHQHKIMVPQTFASCVRMCLFFIIFAGALFPFPFTIQLQPHLYASVTIGSIYFWMYMAIWVLLLQGALQQQRWPSTCSARFHEGGVGCRIKAYLHHTASVISAWRLDKTQEAERTQ